MILGRYETWVFRQMGRFARAIAICVAASLVVASTDICTATQEARTAEILAIQSLVADILAPVSSAGNPSSIEASTVLDVQRLLSGISESDEGPASTTLPVWWALSPAPLRGLSLDAASVTRLIEVPRAADEGRQQQVQPFPPPPLSRVMERYRMMLTPHAPPLSAPPNRQIRLNNQFNSTWSRHHEIYETT